MPEAEGGTKDYRDAGDEVTLVYATFPSVAAARDGTRPLVEQRLAACINIIPGMTAIYEWEGTIHEDGEVVAIVKTQREQVKNVIKAIRASHPYSNPAILAITVSAGAAPYLDWVIAQSKDAR